MTGFSCSFKLYQSFIYVFSLMNNQSNYCVKCEGISQLRVLFLDTFTVSAAGSWFISGTPK